MQNRGESDCICRAKIGSDAAPILFGRVRFHIALRDNFTRRAPERSSSGARFAADAFAHAFQFASRTYRAVSGRAAWRSLHRCEGSSRCPSRSRAHSRGSEQASKIVRGVAFAVVIDPDGRVFIAHRADFLHATAAESPRYHRSHHALGPHANVRISSSQCNASEIAHFASPFLKLESAPRRTLARREDRKSV